MQFTLSFILALASFFLGSIATNATSTPAPGFVTTLDGTWVVSVNPFRTHVQDSTTRPLQTSLATLTGSDVNTKDVLSQTILPEANVTLADAASVVTSKPPEASGFWTSDDPFSFVKPSGWSTLTSQSISSGTSSDSTTTDDSTTDSATLTSSTLIGATRTESSETTTASSTTSTTATASDLTVSTSTHTVVHTASPTQSSLATSTNSEAQAPTASPGNDGDKVVPRLWTSIAMVMLVQGLL